LVATELSEARAIKASFEQRALALVSASGVFVTALFGLAAFLGRGAHLPVASNARPPLYAALGLFVVAALLSLAVNAPTKYLGIASEPDDEQESGLEKILRKRWDNPPAIARRRVALTRYALNADHQRANSRKATLLKWATAIEAAAILALGASVALTLNG
jgi:hypothetical protein